MTCDMCGSGKCHDIRGFNVGEDETFQICFFCMAKTEKFFETNGFEMYYE